MPFDAAHAIGNIVLRPDRRPGDGADAGPLPRALRVGQGEGAAPPAAEGPGALAPRLRGGGVVALLLAALALGAGARSRRRLRGQPGRRLAAIGPEHRRRFRGLARRRFTSAEMTGWAMLGLEAAGRNPLDVSHGGQHPGRLICATASSELKSPGDLARTILALEGAGVDPRNFGGREPRRRAAVQAPRRRLLRRLARHAPPSASSPCARPVPPAASTSSLSWLRGVQNNDGGWGDVPGSPSTADGTGAVMQALSGESKAAQPRPLLPAHRPATRGWLPARRQRCGQHPVDRLGDPGDHRRRRRPGLLSPWRQERPRLPLRPAGERRPLPLLRVQRPDPDLGYRPGPGRRRRRVPSPSHRPPREPKPAQSTAKTSGPTPALRTQHQPAPPRAAPGTPGLSPASPVGPGQRGWRTPPERSVRPPGQSTPGASAGVGPARGAREGGVRHPRIRTVGVGRAHRSLIEERPRRRDSPRPPRRLRSLFAAALAGRRLWMHQRYGL